MKYNINKNFVAFTLSEVLITLGIIGVVAAITIPVVINKVTDIHYDIARQKALNTIGEAAKIISIHGDMGQSLNAEDFVKNQLSKKLNIIKYCGNIPTNCGFSEKIYFGGKNIILGKTEGTVPVTLASLNSLNFSTLTSNQTKDKNYNINFLTANGYSVNLFYNPYCKNTPFYDKHEKYISQDYVCVNAIYDMNAKKGPNVVGKDIGWVTIIGNDENVIAVAPAFESEDKITNVKPSVAQKSCSAKGETLPNIYELTSLVYNRFIFNTESHHYWSAKTMKNKYKMNGTWMIYNTDGSAYLMDVADSNVRCIKR